jgi:predicted transcriptional regulator
MTVHEIRDILDAGVITGEKLLETEVFSACGSDMMSDVLAFVKHQSVLLTGLVNSQVVRTAEMMDMRCIVFVRGKMPEENVEKLANERGIVLLSTSHRMFNACGLLYSHGLKGGGLNNG